MPPFFAESTMVCPQKISFFYSPAHDSTGLHFAFSFSLANMTSHRTSFILLLLTVSIISCSFDGRNAPDEEQISYKVSLQDLASDLKAPVGMAVPMDGTQRLFIIEQTGRIMIYKNGALVPQPFLDVSSLLDDVNSFYSEKGLLGLAFHPGYRNNRKFYIYYSAPAREKGMDHESVIAEYTASSNPDIAHTTGRIVMTFGQPESNHNGGMLAFGPDGYLYIGTGDGGGAGDKHGTIGNGQNLQTKLGKILRIDVNQAEGYGIPADNPFVGKNADPSVWAYGLRNPWRFSFDRKSGALFCADVGQNEWEEINMIEKGKNYGWRIMEGNHCYDPAEGCKTSGLERPIDEYDHGTGISVTGGYVYRGARRPDMQGKYIFGDWKGKMFMLLQTPEGRWERRQLTISKPTHEININSFGEDENGELYVLGQNSTGPRKGGTLYRIVFE